MINNRSKLSIILILFLIIIACKEQKENSNEKDTITEEVEMSKGNKADQIVLEKLQDSPAYSDAALVLQNPSNLKITSEGEIDFAFEVENYELGAQTDSPNATLLANSGKGQHIHFILNNQPYSAHYTSSFKKEIPDGVHHLVAFLSRSYHESVKNERSVVVQKLEIGTNVEDSKSLDVEAPTLIYSRPKGEYSGKDTENLMLDFFVLNTTLSENGNKVRATVNNQEFIITEWAPQVLKGLPKGEITIKLELVDAQGNLIPGPFNSVTRTVMLKE